MSRPFIPAPNCAQVELIYTSLGQLMENALHVKSNTPFTLSLLQELREVFRLWDASSWYLYRHGAVTLSRIRTKALDSDTSPMEDYSLVVPKAGGLGGYLYSLNATFCIKLSTGNTGRSARGRLFFPGMTSASATSNTVDATWRNNVIASLNALAAALVAHNANWKLVVVSYRHDKAWRLEAVPYAINTFVAVDDNVDSQRRRLTGRGHT